MILSFKKHFIFSFLILFGLKPSWGDSTVQYFQETPTDSTQSNSTNSDASNTDSTNNTNENSNTTYSASNNTFDINSKDQAQTYYYNPNTKEMDYSKYGYKVDHFAPGHKAELGLTDEEKQIKDHFYHTGLANKITEEECANNPDACSGKDVEKNNLVEMASKLYSMMVGAIGGKVNIGVKEKPTTADDKMGIKNPDGQPGGQDEAKSLKDEKLAADEKSAKNEINDYCRFIPMGTETIALATQQAKQQTISQEVNMNGENAQKEALYQVKRTHEARAETSDIQVKGWTASTVCYTAEIGYGAYKGNIGTTMKNLGWRLAASAFFMDYFKKIKKKQENYADDVQKVIDSLPKMGDCNPVTERNCYCGEESSKQDANYMKYCLPQAFKQSMANSTNRISCLDDQMQEDPECNCLQTNTCYDNTFSAAISSSPYGRAIASQAITPMAELSRGYLDTANLDSASLNAQNAAQKLLAKYDPYVPVAGSLNPDQAKEALSLTEAGVPARLARSMAQESLTPAQQNIAKKFADSLQGMNNSYAYNPRRSGPYLSKGSGTLAITQKNAPFDPFDKLKQKQKDPNQKIMKFKEESKSRAEIDPNKNHSIFEIISKRYQLSSWPIMIDF